MTGATAWFTIAPDGYHRNRKWKVAACLRPAPLKRVGPSQTSRRQIAWWGSPLFNQTKVFIGDSIPTSIIYERPTGITGADRAKIAVDIDRIDI